MRDLRKSSEYTNKVAVEIFGDEYVIKGEADPQYMEMLAAYVDKKMRQIGGRNPQLSRAKLAVLVAINLADELSKLQEDYDTLVKLIEEEKGK